MSQAAAPRVTSSTRLRGSSPLLGLSCRALRRGGGRGGVAGTPAENQPEALEQHPQHQADREEQDAERQDHHPQGEAQHGAQLRVRVWRGGFRMMKQGDELVAVYEYKSKR